MDVQRCGEATDIIHLFQEKQPVDLDDICTAHVAVEYCSNQVRKLLQTDLIWNFTIVVLPFLMQFFSLFRLIDFHYTAGSLLEILMRCRNFDAFKKYQNRVF